MTSPVPSPRPHQRPLMSSAEIADLTGKRHDHVIRDIRAMLKDLAVDAPNLGDQYEQSVDARGYTAEYWLDRELTDILLTGYSVRMRRRVIVRWHELERQQAEPQVPKTLAQALRLAADQAEQIELQAAQIEQQRPAVEFVEQYATSTGNKGFREVCKLLKVKENAFRDFLVAEKIMYRLGGDWVAYAQHLDAGRFAVSTGTAEHAESSHAYNQHKFTPKGVAWIAGEWAKFNLPKTP